MSSFSDYLDDKNTGNFDDYLDESSLSEISLDNKQKLTLDKVMRSARLAYDKAGAQLTYQFDDNGDLCYMEYKSNLGGDREYIASIRIFNDTPEEINDKIKPYTENLIVGEFSWSDAQAKHIDAEFNIRQDSFVNNGGTPITGPVEAARLALKEYPNLGEYLSLDVFRDETTGMWKVTIEAYVDYQSTYCYRDIYLSDSGATQLLVYEGPIGYDESRK